MAVNNRSTLRSLHAGQAVTSNTQEPNQPLKCCFCAKSQCGPGYKSAWDLDTQPNPHQLARRFAESVTDADCSCTSCRRSYSTARSWLPQLRQWLLQATGLNGIVNAHTSVCCPPPAQCIGSHSVQFLQIDRQPGVRLPVTRASDLLKAGNSTSGALSRLHNKLISVTLVTRSAEILIGATLQSVATSVDACLVLYSSSIQSPELTLRAAAQAVGGKLIVQEIQGGQPLSVMLDSSLDWARQLGAGWALLIDQDQQLKPPAGVHVQEELAGARQAGVSQVNCLNTHLDYARPFLVDLSQGGSYVHDVYIQPHGSMESTLRGCIMDRPKKTSAWTERRAREALQVIANGDLARSSAAANAQNSQSHNLVGLYSRVGSGKAQAASFVKAEAFWTLGQHQEAREAWQGCTNAEDQIKALAALCAWKWVRNVGSEEQEKETAVAALIKAAATARSPELFWLAAFTKYYAEEYESAKQLASEAVKLGCFTGECPGQGRIHSEEARYEWPFDVLYYSLSKLGDAAGAEVAKAQRDMANANRLSHAM